MEPLITNGVDPALLRVLERHGREREAERGRRRLPANAATEENENEEKTSPLRTRPNTNWTIWLEPAPNLTTARPLARIGLTSVSHDKRQR